VGGKTSRELFALTNEVSTVVISIRLTTIPEAGDIARMVHVFLSTHLIGNVYYISLPFEFGTTAGVGEYNTKMLNLVERLTSGDLSQYFSSFLQMFWSHLNVP
jgi:hypothetical protein